MSTRLQEIKDFRIMAATKTVDELKVLFGQATELDTKVYLLHNLKDAESKLEDIKAS